VIDATRPLLPPKYVHARATMYGGRRMGTARATRRMALPRSGTLASARPRGAPIAVASSAVPTPSTVVFHRSACWRTSSDRMFPGRGSPRSGTDSR
jgi:hypothetical protein